MGMKDMIDNSPMMVFGKLISRSTFGKSDDEEDYVFGLFELIVMILYAIVFFYAVSIAIKKMDKIQDMFKKVIEILLAVTVPGPYVLIRGG
jgi:hypothetical protein